MAKVVLVLATTDQPLPAGVAAFSGKYLMQIADGVAQIVSTTTAEFDSVADGSYSATCVSLDASGAPMNDSVSVSFVVSTPVNGTPPAPPAPAPSPATYPAPSGLTANVTY